MKEIEIGIVGGGLAGLVAAIHLKSSGKEVILFEKEAYPNHKVCGEYLSNEILPYLKQLGINLEELKPKHLDKLTYSTSTGKIINTGLPLGGIGISRFALDHFLYRKALDIGVNVIQTQVNNIQLLNDAFEITSATNGVVHAKIVLGAFGKRSLLDKKLNRDFISQKSEWLAVKSHYKLDEFPDDLVMLHNFKGGYCGLSKTESGAINVCYLTSFKSFKNYKDTTLFKREVLSKNPHLQNFFKKATPIFEKELSIAQISFGQKTVIHNHILMLGDAAGLIHPLSGNGMAMAIHSAKLASECVVKHTAKQDFSREELEKQYQTEWEYHFKSRLRTGRILQKILLSPVFSRVSQLLISIFPFLLPRIIAKTHGKPVE